MTQSPLIAQRITSITIEDELKQSYLAYAMSVIVGRALPDVRDGLKPVHRRVLFAMSELGNDWNKPYKKSARIVGDVIGKYHPHGDTAVYDTLVRMAQPFSLRYLLIDGQGNFGSVDGDSAAAMRYTEIRMSKLAHYLLADLEKNTVDFVPNYDENEHMPVVLPTRFPNLLVNGSSGIAVGMATNIPPHNLGEVVDATVAMIDNPDISMNELIGYIPGPDFPTAGMINGRDGIISAYRTGRGRVYVRAKAEIETNEKTQRASIIVSELPYQVNKAKLLERIAEMVRDKQMEGITGLRDESDKQGMRMVIEVRKGEEPEVVLNNLYAHTAMQTAYHINMVALDNGQPRLLNLKQLIGAFIQHRRTVVTRRSLFELAKARDRAHLLEGLAIALSNIDAIIALIKAAKTPAEAKEHLLATCWSVAGSESLLDASTLNATRPTGLEAMYGLKMGESGRVYQLSPIQAQAILDLRLHRLTGLEIAKIHEEYQQIIKTITELLDILSNPDRLHGVIREELLEIKALFGDLRRTQIQDLQHDLSREDLIAAEPVVVTLSQQGYIKSQSLSSYQAQHRGGRGKAATAVKEKDFVKNMLVASTHDVVLCFSTAGKVYALKVYQVPQGSRIGGGRPIVNLLPLVSDEKISAILPVQDFNRECYIFMTTAKGMVKKVALSECARVRLTGKIVIGLGEGDTLVSAQITTGNDEVMLISDAGKVVRFHEGGVRPTGRSSRGIRGMKLKDNQSVMSQITVRTGCSVLTATVCGYGQRTKFEDYPLTQRGGQGVIAIQITPRNGTVVAATCIADDADLLLISDQGTLVRTPAHEISVIGRNTQGVRLIHLGEGETLVGIEAVDALPSEQSEVLDVTSI